MAHPPRNRLAAEQSPYLLQHAGNPVDWYPWGAEAFERARREDRPIFLSIGYATCHWCHVMERESFEDEAVAGFLNQHFVSIKVDREERPDVDEIYMTAVQALAGQGGWPLSAFLTPDLAPFYGGTYFPPRSRYGRPGFLELLHHIVEVWQNQRERVLASAADLTGYIQEAAAREAGGGELTERALEGCAKQLLSRLDARHGGFGGQQKFPTPHNVGLLLRWHQRSGDAPALAAATKTLDAMLERGLRDHLGGGFHRYCVDPGWEIPHFEKMLYDQAGLVRVYVEAFQVTGDRRYAEVVRETLAFVQREMTTPEGAFTSAWDADSEGKEGKFYVWTRAEVERLLGDDFPLFALRYTVTEQGNWDEEPGENHLQLRHDLAQVAQQSGLPADEVAARLAACRAKLLDVRARRVPPLHDDKVLADWNGFMAGSFALAGRALEEPAWVEAGARAAEFVLERLRGDDGQRMHRWRAGQTAVPAMLDDHAYLAWGCLELYEATLEPRWLARAGELARAMLERFEDPAGGFYQVEAGTTLLYRPKPTYDGAMPAGNSVAAYVLARLGLATGDEALAARGRAALASHGGALARTGGLTGAFALQALDLLLGPASELVVAGELTDPATAALLRVARSRFLPRTVLVHRPAGEAGEIARLAPFVAAQAPVDGRATAYLCRDHACQRPVHEPEALAALLAAG